MQVRTTRETLPSLLLALVAVAITLAAGALVVADFAPVVVPSLADGHGPARDTGGLSGFSLLIAPPMLVVAVAIGAIAVRSYRRAGVRLPLAVFSGLGVALMVEVARQVPGHVVVLEWNSPIPTLFAVVVMAATWGGLYRSGIK